MNLLKRPSLYLAVFGVAGIIFLVTNLQSEGPDPVPLNEPAKTPFNTSIGGRGIVESLDENVRIAPTLAGRVSKVMVQTGEEVSAGDPLFSVDSRAAAADVALKEKEILLLEARARQSGVTVADRLEKLERSQALVKRNALSEDEARRDDFAYQLALTAQETAQADVELAKAGLESAKVFLDLHLIRAPRNGRVLFSDIREGEYAAANPGDGLMLIGDIEQFQLRVDIDEESASKVVAGAQAVAFPKGDRSTELPLHFVRIDPYVLPKKSLSGESTERVDTRVLQVIYRFETPDFPVYVGQQMDVFIQAPGSITAEKGEPKSGDLSD